MIIRSAGYIDILELERLSIYIARKVYLTARDTVSFVFHATGWIFLARFKDIDILFAL